MGEHPQKRLSLVENVAEIELSDRSHLPFARPFDDGIDKCFGVLVTGEISCDVEMYGAPIPPLRHDAGPAGAHTGTADFRQQNPEFGCNARSRLLLKNAGLYFQAIVVSIHCELEDAVTGVINAGIDSAQIDGYNYAEFLRK